MKSASRTRRDKNVTLQDIASRCDVTKATVFHVVHGNRKQVSDGKYYEIMAVVKELGYDSASQQAARRLSLQKQGQRVLNHLIAMVFPRHLIRDPYYWRILQGIMDASALYGFGVLSDYDNSADLCARMLPIYARGEVDGAVVLADPDHFKPVLDHLRLHRKSGLFTWRDGLLLGFLASFPASPAASCTARSKRCSAGRPAEAARDIVVSALDAYPDATAILAPNDPGAVWIGEFLKERGLKVPGDISLIGYDDARALLGANNQNILTTVHVPLEELGEQAAKMMSELVTADEPAQRRLVLAPNLVIRGSTAPPSRRKA